MSSMRKRFKYTIFWKQGLFWLAKTTFAIAFEIKFLMKPNQFNVARGYHYLPAVIIYLPLFQFQ